MTWVKVCGITNREAAAAAVRAGADAVGFVFYPKSPRHIDQARARELGGFIAIDKVAVTVDAPWRQVLELVDQTGVDGVQPHGRHAAEVAAAARKAGMLVLRPVVVGAALDLSVVPVGEIPLLDGTTLGGTGHRFDWTQIGHQDRDFILAGGLSPTNVAEAIALTGAWGVDASSGLESAPGVKDPDLVTAFVREAKA